MKYLLTILLATQLTGCVYQSVNSHDIQRAQKICEYHKSEIVSIDASALGSEFVNCSGGEGILIWGEQANNILKEKE